MSPSLYQTTHRKSRTTSFNTETQLNEKEKTSLTLTRLTLWFPALVLAPSHTPCQGSRSEEAWKAALFLWNNCLLQDFFRCHQHWRQSVGNTYIHVGPSYRYEFSPPLHQQLQYRTDIRPRRSKNQQSRSEAVPIRRIEILLHCDLLTSVPPGHLNWGKRWWSRKAGAHVAQLGWTLGLCGQPSPRAQQPQGTVDQSLFTTKVNSSTSRLKNPHRFLHSGIFMPAISPAETVP